MRTVIIICKPFLSKLKRMKTSPHSRKRSSSDGPFSPNVRHTQSGIFSAMIWRAITFASPFSFKHQMVFLNLRQFTHLVVVVSLREGSEYFCDSLAYGTKNPQRPPNLAPIYWEATGSHDWQAYTAKGLVPFMSCYKKYLHPSESPARFPQLGRLTAYLLTADYVYAGVVEMPTLDEIGRDWEYNSIYQKGHGIRVGTSYFDHSS
jgi:hypothetical protein